jgi:hypothetical protein
MANTYNPKQATKKPSQPTNKQGQHQAPQPLALPNQSLVMFQQLKTATQADMVAIDRMFDKRKEVVASHYDRRASEFGAEMAAQFGVEVDEDFFDQGLTLDSALAEFDLLLTPATEEPIDEAPATDTTIEVSAVPV